MLFARLYLIDHIYIRFAWLVVKGLIYPLRWIWPVIVGNLMKQLEPFFERKGLCVIDPLIIRQVVYLIIFWRSLRT